MSLSKSIEYEIFPSLKKALESLGEDKKYDYENHKFSRGEEIKRHYHPKANEFVIVDQGKFSLIAGKEKFDFHIKGKAYVIKITKGIKHSLLVKSKISYFVFRDKRDKIIYC